MKTKFLFLIFTLCVISTPVFADLYGTVDVVYQGLVRGYTALQMTATGGNYITQHDVGLHLLDLGTLDTSGAHDILPSDSYLVEGLVQAFCIDLVEGYPSSFYSSEYDAVSLDAAPQDQYGVQTQMGLDKAGYIAQLLNTYAYDTALNAAAMQVAMWEIIVEPLVPTNWNVEATYGDFYLNTVDNPYGERDVMTAANGMLSDLTQADSFSMYTALSEIGKDYQDFVLVPTPAAVILGILGLGVAGWKLRRFA